MAIFWMIAIGLLVGLVARVVLFDHNSMNIGFVAVLGIVGSIMAGFFGQGLSFYHADDPVGMLGSVIGATVVVMVYRTSTVRHA